MEDGQPISPASLLEHLKEETLTFQETGDGASAWSGMPTHAGRNLRDARQEFEKEFILKTLKEHDWNVSRTAAILGIERSHLHRKIKSYGIEA